MFHCSPSCSSWDISACIQVVFICRCLAARIHEHQWYCFSSPYHLFSSDIVKPQVLQLHSNTITILHPRNTMIPFGQKVRSQREIAFYQANSPSGRCEWGAAQRWTHLYLEDLMSLSGGGYHDTDFGTVTLLLLCRHHFWILQPSDRYFHLFRTVVRHLKTWCSDCR